ncbi:hypothetical protein BD770DRAFT_91969 [Pilaira anomala]|nr:hypothetical protein BD770DRAFT_91969 [Pilaira anomala]
MSTKDHPIWGVEVNSLTLDHLERKRAIEEQALLKRDIFYLRKYASSNLEKKKDCLGCVKTKIEVEKDKNVLFKYEGILKLLKSKVSQAETFKRLVIGKTMSVSVSDLVVPEASGTEGAFATNGLDGNYLDDEVEDIEAFGNLDDDDDDADEDDEDEVEDSDDEV